MGAVRSGGGPALSARRVNTLLAVCCAGVVLAGLDMFVVNVALPPIGREFGVTLATESWVINAYAVAYAAFLVPLGRIADRTSRKKGFLLGVALFTAMSGACAAANGIDTLIACRVLQAVGAAMLTPTSLSLLLTTPPPGRRPSAVRLWASMGGVAAAAGPVVGGLLVAVSWRLVFVINVPLGVVALVVGAMVVPETPGDRSGAFPDVAGSVVLTVAIGALVFGLVNAGIWGWASPGVLASLGASGALLPLFLLRNQRHRSPVLPPALMRIRAFAAAVGAALLFSVAFGAMLLSIVVLAQYRWGWSPLATGLAIAPGPLLVPVVAMSVTGRLTQRIGVGAVIATGSTVFGAGCVWWAVGIGARPDFVGGLLGGMVVTGVGVGLALPAVVGAAVSSVPAERFTTGSAVVNMVRQVGYAVGAALVVVLVGAAGAHPSVHRLAEVWYVIAAVSLATAVAVLPLIVRRWPAAPVAPPVAAAAAPSTPGASAARRG